jgi:DNA-binding NtrC family response regulator
MNTYSDSSSNNNHLIYAIDDDLLLGDIFSYVGEATGFDVEIVPSGKVLKSKLRTKRPDLLVMDIVMPNMDGIELINWFAEVQCKLPVVLMSGYDSSYLNAAAKLAAAQKINVVGSLQKPIAIETLEKLFRKLKLELLTESSLVSYS